MTYPANIPITTLFTSENPIPSELTWILANSGTDLSADDPQPINAKLGVLFNTGENTGANSLTIYLRGSTAHWLTGEDYQGVLQEELDTRPQLDPGVLTDPLSGVFFELKWGETTQITIGNFWQNSYTPTLYTFATDLWTFASEEDYLFLVSLQEETARAQIYTANNPRQLIYDTGEILDTSTFIRQAGRVGYFGSLTTGTVFEIRPYSLMFAEYQSAVFNSFTPVAAARLYATCTDKNELFSSWAYIDGGAPSNDFQRYYRGDQDNVSSKISLNPGEGIVSSTLPLNSLAAPFEITDWEEFAITFYLWFPKAPLRQGAVLSASLISFAGYNSIAVTLPPLAGGQWEAVKVSIPRADYLTGLYQFQLVCLGLEPVTFWLDCVSIYQRAIKWSARSIASDPWNSNYAPWTDFQDLYNQDHGGVFFPNSLRGNQFQTRGQALVQNAQIFGSVKAVPKYAQLGRLVFSD